MGSINDLELTSNSQSFYDCFNNFIMSDDTRVFNKLIARTLLYQEVKNVPGDIVECGVFKGNGIFSFLKIKRLFSPNTYKKIVGFDFFDTEELLNSIKNSHDKDSMSNLFGGRNFTHGQTFKEKLEEELLRSGFNSNEFVLVEVEFENGAKQWHNVYTTKSGKWHSIDRGLLEVLTVGAMRQSFPDMCDMKLWELVGAKTWADKAFEKNPNSK